MREGFVNINGIVTKVATWGGWIEEEILSESKEEKEIIICIPGNPGVTEFYMFFLERLYQQLDSARSVWIVGHAGHEQVRKGNTSDKLYGLQDQIEHKANFIKKYALKNGNTRIRFIGHSVGAYMITELLKDPFISEKVIANYLLFPTVENIGNTPNGRFISKVFRVVPILIFLAWIFSLLPPIIRLYLLSAFMYMNNIPKMHRKAIYDFVNPDTIRQVFFLAKQEMDQIKERNNLIFISFKDKIKLYYTIKDGWVPLNFFNKINKDIPNLDVELCNLGITHAFVLNHSKQMAEVLSEWIKKPNKQ